MLLKLRIQKFNLFMFKLNHGWEDPSKNYFGPLNYFCINCSSIINFFYDGILKPSGKIKPCYAYDLNIISSIIKLWKITQTT